MKLIDGRWEVVQFVPEHNHPLVHKPSLTKYLRSHQGIPREEKDFLRNVHSTNLTAGTRKNCLFYSVCMVKLPVVTIKVACDES